MASLRARHSRSCGLWQWTTFKDAQGKNGTRCTCTPMYHLAFRVDGRLRFEPVGHNRKEASRALDARRGDLARGKYRPVESITFGAWADEWLHSATVKATSRRAYDSTLVYAKTVFGQKKVRDLTPTDVGRFLDKIREENGKKKREDGSAREVAAATLAKHLRQLGACLQAAHIAGYTTENPVRRLHKTARPKVQKSRPSYFTSDELTRLWTALAERPIYLAVCKLAVSTGMRCGELAALRWSDVDFLNREIHVSRAWSEGVGDTSTKSGQARTIDLTPGALSVLEGWYRASDNHDRLIFHREEGGRISCGYLLRQVLYPAMTSAGVPRIGERGRARTFHSFRHTFARIALESGAEITWVQRQLGHSSITLTVDTYGSWAREAEKAQAQKLAGAFPV